MNAGLKLPRLYAIVDPDVFASNSSKVLQFAEELLKAGVKLMQLRDKKNSPQHTLSLAREIKRVNRERATLIMNDRSDFCLAADFAGVHLGQDDLSAQAARGILGEKKIIGISSHNLDQIREADSDPADYIAFGPIFATSSKAKPDPEVGLDGLREARRMTSKPLVAIGGITPQNCREVIGAGADSVAVISALIDSPAQRVKEFLRVLG
jgi:thiamine-phosphate pyrophosphorylase